MFHVELSQFPHKTHEFNVSADALGPVLDAWVREQYIEVGERKWNSVHASMRILEGPELAPNEISLGRGWASAARVSEDVTERMLGAAGELASASSATPEDLVALLGEEPAPLLRAWREAAASSPGLPPSETLARAEAALATADHDAS